MKSLADGLPAEIAAQIHPDWRKNERDYWTVRDQLLPQYGNQWVAFAEGTVIVAGRRPVEILGVAFDSGKHPYVTCVGREDAPTRMRRAQFAYDIAYEGEPLPVASIEFRNERGTAGVLLNEVILDTGSDASSMPWEDCERLSLNAADGTPAGIIGVGNSTAQTIAFRIWAFVDGQEHACHLHADFDGVERILGRDVLNRLEVLFRGPTNEIVINP